MNERFRNALIAGLLAAVVWMIIATLVGLAGGSVVGWGIGLLVVGFVGTFVIESAIVRSRAGRR
ncbi:hypothetical protein EV383_3549 [Pseudonocardia sediminis]|uniref:Uncharacterized protein n=1 Tax=Pseudonocardia sediminis TaxID=1397368 RepID=A0A4Q7UXB8_PSEST|nr:hypothetical protein [Pseudonocardia sediminis]RZT86652.1 hypothetical protein EV383_3549 [Pseudonocardia sediminis]